MVNKRWDKENVVHVSVLLNKKIDKDLVDFFEEKKEKGKYIKKLIREDIENGNGKSGKI